MDMERFFNTAGPQTPDSYTIDPLSRFDLEEVLLMIRQHPFFRICNAEAMNISICNAEKQRYAPARNTTALQPDGGAVGLSQGC